LTDNNESRKKLGYSKRHLRKRNESYFKNSTLSVVGTKRYCKKKNPINIPCQKLKKRGDEPQDKEKKTKNEKNTSKTYPRGILTLQKEASALV
jgi:hypothetical protein